MTSFPEGIGSLPRQLANYWEYWVRNWKAPQASIFRPGSGTITWPEAWAQEEQTVSSETGYPVRFHFGGGGGSQTWVVPGPGWDIACSSVVYTSVFTNPGGFVEQDAARETMLPSLAPGKYTSVVETKLVQPCFYAFPDGTALIFGVNPTPVAIVGYGKRP
jgi:hypothetical protein